MLLKMPQKLLKTAHYMELGSYHHWPVLLPQRIRLYTYEQIPLFLKENPYITDGYRAHLPSKLCIRRWDVLLSRCNTDTPPPPPDAHVLFTLNASPLPAAFSCCPMRR